MLGAQHSFHSRGSGFMRKADVNNLSTMMRVSTEAGTEGGRLSVTVEVKGHSF